MRLIGTPTDILMELRKQAPELNQVLRQARAWVPRGSKEVYEYQAAAIYVLARRYNRPERHLMEIGTYYGYTAAIIGQAAPKAKIVTLNVLEWEVKAARQYLQRLENVKVVQACSWDFLKDYRGPKLSFVFVDGDHKRVVFDLPWWEHIETGGLFLFHDYAPEGTPRGCPPVYNTLNKFQEEIDQDPDVLVVDDSGVGMIGWRKKP